MTGVILSPMKTAVSLPDELFRRAERLAGRLGIPRSRLYAQALAEYLERHRHDGVTEALDAIYRAESSALDEELEKAQRRVLDEDW
jgi:predicted transcriptional regulator